MYLDDTQFLKLTPTDRRVLNSELSAGKISHAYLIVGTDSEAGEQSSRELLSAVLSENKSSYELMLRRISARTHADVLDVFPEGASIKIAQVRVMKEFVIKEPLEGGFRAVLFHRAETLGTAAQNALLRTLEEPLGSVISILCSDSLEAILPTIRSRTVLLQTNSGALGGDEKAAVRFSAARMSALIEEGSVTSIIDTALALGSGEGNKAAKNDRAAAIQNVGLLLMYFMQLLKLKTIGGQTDSEEMNRLAAKLSNAAVIKIIEIIKQTIEDLKRNASVRLGCEAMLIRIWEECNAENSWNQI